MNNNHRLIRVTDENYIHIRFAIADFNLPEMPAGRGIAKTTG